MIAHYSLVDAMIDARLRTQNKSPSQAFGFHNVSPVQLIDRNNGQLEILLTYAFGARDNKLLLENGALYPIFARQSLTIAKPYKCSYLQWPANLQPALDTYFSVLGLATQVKRTRSLQQHPKALSMAARATDMALATIPGTLSVSTIKDPEMIQQSAVYDIRSGTWRFRLIPT